MSSWTSVLEQLVELDPSDFDPADLSDEQLRGHMPLVQQGINRLAAVLTAAVGAAERRQAQRADGMVSMRSWLAGHCGLSRREAAGLVRAATRLPQLPALAAAFAAGEVTAGHVAVVTAAVTPARVAKAAAAGIDLSMTDRILTDAALALGPEDTGAAVRRWVAGIDPDGALDDAADTRRRLTLSPGLDGRVHLRGHLDAAGGEALHTALAAVIGADRPAGDTRSHAERHGDALVTLARAALASGRLPDLRGERPQVRVSIDLLALCAERNAAGVAGGELSFAGPIPAETARRLACDAVAIRMITGPDGLPLDVGRAQRTATAAIRRAAEARDRHCVFAGCTAPPAFCDIHHLQHWAHGGPTSLVNSALLCERHHTACHEGGFTVTRDPATGTWHTYRPDGTEILPRGTEQPP